MNRLSAGRRRPTGGLAPIWLRVSLATVAGLALVCADAGAAFASLSNSNSVGANVLTAGRIFPGSRASGAWTVSDASSGTAASQNDVLSYAGDLRTLTTGVWAATFSTTRYFELTYNAPLATGIAVTSPVFNLDYRRSGTTATVCFYFEVRQASTGTVLATYGSSGSPVGCNATSALQATSTPIPIVTTTTAANDLAIRVYMNSSGATKTVIIDRATVSGSTAYQSFTLYEGKYVDASTGTAATTVWPFDANDSTYYTSASAWTTGFSSTRYLSFAFPANVPSGVVVTAATFTRAYHAATAGDSLCWYLDVLNGASLIGTHGSSGSPISCSTSTTTFTTNAVSLPEVNSATIANNTVAKVYVRSSAASQSVDTLESLALTWSLP